jgi:hypothetical protein
VLINFDQTAFDQKIAEEKRLEDERKQAEEAARIKEENEQKAKEAEAQKKVLGDFKAIYPTIKKDYVDKAVKNSDDMIALVTSSSDPYQARQTAKNYKDYFQRSCNVDLNEKLKPVPSELEGDVKLLNTALSDFCLYNGFLASQVVSYLEADSTSKQYHYLDQIAYYSASVKQYRFDTELYAGLIVEKIK